MIRLSADIPEQARQWRNTPAIMRFCRQNHLISDAQQQEWLDKIATDSSIKMFGVEVTEVDRTTEPYQDYGAFYVGVAGLTSISMVHRTAEFSLYIAPEYQSRGYGKDALIELIRYGFHNLGLNRIFGEVFHGNPAMKMFKEVGFVEEGHLRQTYYKEGRFIDSTIISILRSEYDVLYPRS